MAWTDVRKNVFAYVLNKLQLFTLVDPEKLQVDGSSITLNDVEVDPERLPPIPGITITRATLETVKVKLSTQGVFLEASNVYADAVIDQLEPEVALSTFLQSTQSDITNEVSGTASGSVGYGMGDVSSIVSKLADIALAQLTFNITGIQINVELGSTLYEIKIEKAAMAAQRMVSIVGVKAIICGQDPENASVIPEAEDSLDCHPYYNSGEASDDNATIDGNENEEMAQSMMIGSRGTRFASDLAQSIYFDTIEENENPSPSTADECESHTGEFARIDNLQFAYSLDPFDMKIEIDRLRLQLIPTVYALVDILNFMLQDAQDEELFDKPTPADQEQSVSLTSMIDMIEIEDNGGITTINGVNIALPILSIEDMSVPNVFHGPTIPLLVGNITSSRITAEFPASLSIFLPQELIGYSVRLVTRVIQAVRTLRAPRNPKPTPVTVQMPEIRIVIGNVTAIVFPEVVDSSSIRLSEVTIIAEDGQLLLKNVHLGYDPNDYPAISLSDVNILATDGFIQSLRSIVASSIDLSLSSTSKTEAKPFSFKLNRMADIQAGHITASLPTLCGSIECSGVVLRNGKGRIGAFHGSIGKNDVRCNAEFRELATGTWSFDINNFAGDIWLQSPQLAENHPAGTENAHKFEYSLPEALSAYSARLTANGSLSLHHLENKGDGGGDLDGQETTTVVSAKVVTKVMGGTLEIRSDLVGFSFLDGESYIPILQIKDLNTSLRLNPQPIEIQVDIGSIVCGCCADSYQKVLSLLNQSLQQSGLPSYTVEPENIIDTLEDISFSTNNDPKDPSIPPLDVHGPEGDSFESDDEGRLDPKIILSGDIDMDETYMTGARCQIQSREREWADDFLSLVRVRVTRIKVHLYDGFDFLSTRRSVDEAVREVEETANDLDPSMDKAAKAQNDKGAVDGDRAEEDVVIGNVLYNSVFITTTLKSAGELRSKIDRTIGSKSYARSPSQKMTLLSVGLSVTSRQFTNVDGVYSKTDIRVADLIVEDKVETSRFKRCLERQGGHGRFLTVVTEMVNKSTPEQRLFVQCSPLRLRLDQDTLDFITRFFTFDLKHVNADDTTDVPIDSSSGDQPDGNHATSCEISPEDQHAHSSGFIQRAEIMEIEFLIDYMPKTFDYAGLRSGYTSELMNLFVLEEAKLSLRHVVLHGISSQSRLGQELLNLWGPEIRANQLGGILAGLGPIRSVLRLSSSARSSTALSGMKRSASVFMRRTASELLRLLDS